MPKIPGTDDFSLVKIRTVLYNFDWFVSHMTGPPDGTEIEVMSQLEVTK